MAESDVESAQRIWVVFLTMIICVFAGIYFVDFRFSFAETIPVATLRTPVSLAGIFAVIAGFMVRNRLVGIPAPTTEGVDLKSLVAGRYRKAVLVSLALAEVPALFGGFYHLLGGGKDVAFGLCGMAVFAMMRLRPIQPEYQAMLVRNGGMMTRGEQEMA